MEYKIHKVFRQATTSPSLAVVIPKEYAEKLGLVDGSHVFIRVHDGKSLIIEKVANPPSSKEVS